MNAVFDLDGVLLDSESDLSWLDRALDAALAELGVADATGDLGRLFPATVDRIERAAAAFGVEPETLWTVRNRHYTEVKVTAIESGEIGPFADVDALCDLDRDRFIISNSPTEVVDAFVRTAGYGDLFEAWYGRGATLADLDRLKPHPHLYRRLVGETGDREYVYVGDTDGDRRFAEATGMAYVHVDRDGTGAVVDGAVVPDLYEAVERLA